MRQVLTKSISLTNPLDIVLQGCRDGDLHYQEKLYKHCYPDMIKVCCRYAGDMDGAGIIFNNAMLRVFRHIDNYKEEGKLMAWIKSIVVNCSIDFVKKQNKFRDEISGNMADHEISVSPEVLGRISSKEIQKLMLELPKATAVVFNLYIYEGFTHKQIGGKLGISEGTSKWHVNEGRKLMRSKLENFIHS